MHLSCYNYSVFADVDNCIIFITEVNVILKHRDKSNLNLLQLSEGQSGTSSSNSSDWETRSSAESSDDQGTPKLRNKGEMGKLLL